MLEEEGIWETGRPSEERLASEEAAEEEVAQGLEEELERGPEEDLAPEDSARTAQERRELRKLERELERRDRGQDHWRWRKSRPSKKQRVAYKCRLAREEEE